MRIIAITVAARILAILILAMQPEFAPAQQKLDSLDRDRVGDMLHTIANDVRKHYYDPKLHGFDLDKRVQEADGKLKAAASLGEAFTIIAWMLEGLEDSHTFFIPPQRTFHTDYGWVMQMFGDSCYVVHVRPRSDAAAKGLMPGDQILEVNGNKPTRDSFPVMEYYFKVLSPKAGLRLHVKRPDGQERTVDVAANTQQRQKIVDLTAANGGVNYYNLIREAEEVEDLTRTRCADLAEALAICKMAEFNLEQDQVQSMLRRVEKRKSLILDLRGNPGGSVETLAEVAGGFFDQPVKIADRKGRKEMKPQVSRRQHNTFSGEMVVLIDSESASAAEVFARLMQLQKRAIVIGDRSAGAVMEAKDYPYTMGSDTVLFYSAMITDADVIMTDGKSLEGRGVMPDELLLPSPVDLADGKDPVLAHAAERLGYKLSPEAAGKLFPFKWAAN